MLEKVEDVAKLEGALSLLDEKKKKLNWRSLVLKACVMTMFLHYFIENLQVSIYFCLFYHLFGIESFFFQV